VLRAAPVPRGSPRTLAIRRLRITTRRIQRVPVGRSIGPAPSRKDPRRVAKRVSEATRSILAHRGSATGLGGRRLRYRRPSRAGASLTGSSRGVRHGVRGTRARAPDAAQKDHQRETRRAAGADQGRADLCIMRSIVVTPPCGSDRRASRANYGPMVGRLEGSRQAVSEGSSVATVSCAPAGRTRPWGRRVQTSTSAGRTPRVRANKIGPYRLAAEVPRLQPTRHLARSTR